MRQRCSPTALAGLLLVFAASLPAQDNGSEPLEWPREYTAENGARLLLYQPQVVSWDDWERLEARAAVALELPGDEDRSLGVVRLTAKTEVATTDRLVRIFDIELLDARFPEQPQITGRKDPQPILDQLFPSEKVVELDRLLASLERAGVKLSAAQIKADPPPIFVSTSPAILVLIDGEPILADVKTKKLQFVINTNWDLFFQSDDSRYFLLQDGGWLETSSLGDRWSSVDKLPKVFKKLPKDDPSFAEARAAVPGRRILPSDVPRVFVSREPAELILISGLPQLQPIGETELHWVTNTESDLFVYEGSFYYLVAGRWFRAEDLDGEWTFATENLPEGFREIPDAHPRARVLPSVPGTADAQEALIQAQIPQKATVTRGQVEAPQVVYYTGEPKFEPIDDTDLQRATNSQFDVILAGGRYYLCYEAVWFVSASPRGPWSVADTIPAEIYSIPASSPVHSVTYVQVYDSTPTTVTFGYTSGYWGVYYGWGTMVYGTGWYWSPYSYWGPYYSYPLYYPYPVTYGVSAWYNPNTGTYGRGARAYGPYGGMGYGAAYNPASGTYARGAAAWGPYNARGWAEAYNPTTGTYARTRQGADVYGSWGTTGIKRGDDWARTAHYSDDRGSIAGYRTSEGHQGVVARSGSDLYAGRDGNVYRRDESGWQKYDQGGWQNVSRPDAGARQAPGHTGESRPTTGSVSRTASSYGGLDRSTMDQLNRDSYSRQRGSANVSRYGDWNRGGGYGGRGAGGYSGARRGGRRR